VSREGRAGRAGAGRRTRAGPDEG